jgi:hypothetical protein
MAKKKASMTASATASRMAPAGYDNTTFFNDGDDVHVTMRDATSVTDDNNSVLAAFPPGFFLVRNSGRTFPYEGPPVRPMLLTASVTVRRVSPGVPPADMPLVVSVPTEIEGAFFASSLVSLTARGPGRFSLRLFGLEVSTTADPVTGDPVTELHVRSDSMEFAL